MNLTKVDFRNIRKEGRIFRDFTGRHETDPGGGSKFVLTGNWPNARDYKNKICKLEWVAANDMEGTNDFELTGINGNIFTFVREELIKGL